MNRDTTLYFPDLDLDSEVPCTDNQPTKYGHDSIFFPPIVNDWETVNYNSPTHNGSFYGYLPTQEQVESNAVFSSHSHNVKHFSLSQGASTSFLEIPPQFPPIPSFVPQHLSPYANNSVQLSPTVPALDVADTTFSDSDAPSPMSLTDNDYKHSSYQPPKSELRSETYSLPSNYSSPAATSLFGNDNILASLGHTTLLPPDSMNSLSGDRMEREDNSVGPTRGVHTRKKERQLERQGQQHTEAISFDVLRAPSINRKGRKYTKPRGHFPWSKKWEMWEMRISNPIMTQEDLAEKFGVERSTISVASKRIEEFLAQGGTVGDEPHKAPKHYKLDSDLVDILKNCTEDLNDALIIAKARELSKRDGELRDKFKASRSWLCNFKKRNGIECPTNSFVICHSHLADPDIDIGVDATSDLEIQSSSSPYQRPTLLLQPQHNFANDPGSHESNPTAEEADAAMSTILRFVSTNTEAYFSEHIMEGIRILYHLFLNGL